MIAVTAAPTLEGYQVVVYKGVARSETFEELQRNAESLGANAILNICYDGALDVDTLFHGAAVVIRPISMSLPHIAEERRFSPQICGRTKNPNDATARSE
ncbi:MAG TPA: hypothetical protein VGX94_19460 [Terriglobia bacterium]|nr:hypothetical protein [Terriglobia bacterium]